MSSVIQYTTNNRIRRYKKRKTSLLVRKQNYTPQNYSFDFSQAGAARLYNPDRLYFSDELTFEALLFPTGYSAKGSNIFGRNNSSYRWRLQTYNEGLEGALWMTLTYEDESFDIFQASEAVPLNQWTHIAAILKRDGTLTFWYNLKDKFVFQTAGLSIIPPTSGFQIGYYGGRGVATEFFIGYMDELRIWRVVKTRDQLADTINIRLSGNEDHLAYYANAQDQKKGVVTDLAQGNDASVLDGYHIGYHANRLPVFKVPTTEFTLPKPTGLRLTVGDSFISATVDPVNLAYLKGYQWYLDGVKQVVTKEPGYTFTDLTNNRNYTVSISIANKYSNESEAATGEAIPNPPLYGLEFNGVDQYLDMGTWGDFGSQIFKNGCRIEMRLKTSYTDSRKFLFDARAADNPTSLYMRINTTAVGSYKSKSALIIARSMSGRYSRDAGVSDICNGQINAIVMQIKDQRAYIIVNDEVISSNYGTLGTATNFNSIRIAAPVNGHSRFPCRLYELRVWKVSDVDYPLDQPLESDNWAVDYPNLFRYYKLDDRSGDLAKEQIEGDDATLVGNVNNNMWIVET